MNTGIYRIEIGDYFYIGQSIELDKRKSTHLNNLRKGTHCNRMMQSVYNKYQNFSFKVMLNCGADQLDMLEQSALDVCYGDEDCMNLSKDVKSPGRGRIVTAKTRKLMGEARKGKKASSESRKLMSNAKQGKNNPNYGKKGKNHHNYGMQHSSEARKKIGQGRISPTKYTFLHKDGVEETCTQYELRMKYSLDSSGISRLVSGKAKTCKGWRLNNE